MLAFKERVRNEWDKEMVPEESPTGESESNGVVERAIQDVQGQIRTIKDGLEARIGEKYKREQDIVPWLIRHSAQVINRYRV